MNAQQAHETARRYALADRPWADVAGLLDGLSPEAVAVARRTYDNTRSSRARREQRARDRLASARVHVARLRETLEAARETAP